MSDFHFDDRTYDCFQAFVEWGDEINPQIPDSSPIMGKSLSNMAKILEVSYFDFLSTPGCYYPHDSKFHNDSLSGKLLIIVENLDDLLVDAITSMFISRSIPHRVAAIRFMAAVSVVSTVPLPFVYNIFISNSENFDKLVADASSSDDTSLSSYASLLLSCGGSNRYLTDLLVRTELPQLLVKRLQLAYSHIVNHITSRNNSISSSSTTSKMLHDWNNYNSWPETIPLPSDEVYDDSWSKPLTPTDGPQYWILVANGALSLLRVLGEYVELLGPCVSASTATIALELCSALPDNSMVVNAIGFLANAMAHKRLAWEVVDRDGLNVLVQLWQSSAKTLTQSQLALCLHSISSHDIPMETLVRVEKNCTTMVTLGLELLKSSDECTHRNALLFFAEALAYEPVLKLFDEADGIYPILNILRVSSSTDPSTDISKQTASIQKETARLLMLYTRVHTHLDVEGEINEHFCSPLKPVRPDETEFSYIRASLFEYLNMNGSLPPSLLSPSSDGSCSIWRTSSRLLYHRGIPLILRLLRGDSRSTSDLYCCLLNTLELLCVEPEVMQEILNYHIPPHPNDVIEDVVSSNPPPPPPHDRGISDNNSNNHNLNINSSTSSGNSRLSSTLPSTGGISRGGGGDGISILLKCAQGITSRDPTVMIEAIRLLGTLVIPAYFHLEKPSINGNNGNNSDNYPSSALEPRGFYTRKETAQQQARQQIRACNGIKTLIQLLNYRRSAQHVDAIRLATVQVLLGISLDTDIRQLLEKLGLANTVSVMLQTMPGSQSSSSSSWHGSNNITEQLRRKSIQLITMLTSNNNNNSSSTGQVVRHGHGHGQQGLSYLASSHMQPVSATPLTIEREAIVAHTQITFPAEELLVLIRDHLNAVGCCASAAALEAEASLAPIQSSSFRSSHLTPSLKQAIHPNNNNSNNNNNPSSTMNPSLLSPSYSHNTNNTPTTTTTTEEITTTGRSHYLDKSSSATIGTIASPLLTPPIDRKRLPITGTVSAGTSFPRDSHSQSGSSIPTAATTNNHNTSAETHSSRKRPRVETPHIIPKFPIDLFSPSPSTPSAPPNTSTMMMTTPSASASTSSNVIRDMRTKGIVSKTRSSFKTSIYRKRTDNFHTAYLDKSYFSNIHTSQSDHRIPNKSPHPSRQNISSYSLTLTNIVEGFLRHQHLQCTHPVAVLPPFSLLEPHRCPFPTPLSKNILSALMYRSQSAGLLGNNRNGRKVTRDFTYNRWRVWRDIPEEPENVTTCTAFSTDPSRLWVGAALQSGEREGGSLRLFDLVSFSEIGNWSIPSISSMTTSRTPNRPLLLTTTVLAELSALSPVLSYETNLWNASPTGNNEFNTPLIRFPADNRPSIRKPVFSPSATRIAGLHLSNNYRSILTSVFDIESQLAVSILDSGEQIANLATTSNPFRRASICFGPEGIGYGDTDSDNILFSDGVLWDIRSGKIIRRFDRLSDNGSAAFHPNGYSLIMDSAVWDLRQYKLLQTVPKLEGCQVMFQPSGEVLLAYAPYTLEDLHASKRKGDEHTKFTIIDGGDFSVIHERSLEREGDVFWDLCWDHSGLAILSSVVATLDFSGVRAECRVLEPGDETDSDIDDRESEGDDEDGEWQEEEEEEEEDEGEVDGEAGWEEEDGQGEDLFEEDDDDDDDDDDEAVDILNMDFDGDDYEEDDDEETVSEEDSDDVSMVSEEPLSIEEEEDEGSLTPNSDSLQRRVGDVEDGLINHHGQGVSILDDIVGGEEEGEEESDEDYSGNSNNEDNSEVDDEDDDDDDDQK